MGLIGTRENFVSQVISQLIFTKFIQFDTTTPNNLLPSEKLAIRHNKEIYSANHNYVRVSNIDHVRTQFKLLEFKTSFNIKSLQLNPLGTLLALIGTNAVSVVHLSSSLDHRAFVPVKVAYNLENIGGNVIKVVWQSVVANDSSLVVLNDKSQIKCYDISISSSVPQLAIDLSTHKEFTGRAVTSISFGSQTNLIGSLTLYVASSDSDIYCLYPFVPSQSRLVASKEAVEGALQESASIVSVISKKFAYDNSLDSVASPLTRAAIGQFKFYKHLNRQFSSGVPLQSERRNRRDHVIELKRLKHSLPIDYEPSVQGPIFSAESNVMSDLNYIYSNADFTLLVSIATNADKSPLLNYHCQLKPLIMKWRTHSAEPALEAIQLATERKTSVAKKSQAGYVKPKKGFGFMNLSDGSGEDEAGDEEGLAEELEFLKLSRQVEEEEFELTEFTELTTLAVDILPTTAPLSSARSNVSIIKFSDESGIFGLYIGDELIIVRAGQWIDALVDEIYPNNEPQKQSNTKSSSYELLRCDNIHGFGYVNDTVTETGDYLIIVNENIQNNLKVVALQNHDVQHQVARRPLELPKANETEKVVKPQQSLEELKAESDRVGSFDSKTLTKDISFELLSDPIESTVKSLKDVSEISSQTLEQISAISSVAYKTFYTILQQVDQLQNSVRELKQASKLIIPKEKIDSTETRLNKILEKQESLEVKIASVKVKLYDFVLTKRRSNSIPFSKAEKAWSREINSILFLLTKDTDTDKSWVTKERLYESQVSSLIEKFVSNSAEKDSTGAIEKVKERVLEQLLVGLKMQLQRDEEVVNSTKARLQKIIA